jgi:hypothetical protein
MPESNSTSRGPSQILIHHPRCPKCTNRMMLARIAPGSRGFDVRTFECANCEHIQIVTVATDPMKSDAVKWMAGQLKPPR